MSQIGRHQGAGRKQATEAPGLYRQEVARRSTATGAMLPTGNLSLMLASTGGGTGAQRGQTGTTAVTGTGGTVGCPRESAAVSDTGLAGMGKDTIHLMAGRDAGGTDVLS